ncbi:MAG TPA: hypothetical protein VEA78_03390 [Acidimicrobiales bacterium]|nr:hypothetical protein [Acidimicrobiales bacterium]
MSRVLAVLGALAMIVVAVVVRGAIDDDGDATDGRGRDPEGQVVCATELREVCPPGASIEDAATTADRLLTADGVDAWLTFEPWPAIVDDARVRAGLDPLFDEVEPLASSPLVAVGPSGTEETWAEIAGGDLRVGTRDLTGGLGALHLGALATGLVGSTDFATNDLTPAIRSRLDAIAEDAETSSAPVRQLLQSRAFFDVALSFSAEAEAALAAADPSRSAGLTVLYPAPMAEMVAVAAGDAALAGDAGRSLLAAGWIEPGPSNLPSAGVLTALRGLL